MQSDGKFSDLTELIIKSFYKVYNTLGYGFAEKAASALSVLKSELILEDPSGRTRLGESIQDGTNTGQAQPYL